MTCASKIPVLNEGDVNARAWIRIREVEQSLSLASQDLDRRFPAAAIACRSPPERGREARGAGRRVSDGDVIGLAPAAAAAG